MRASIRGGGGKSAWEGSGGSARMAVVYMAHMSSKTSRASSLNGNVSFLGGLNAFVLHGRVGAIILQLGRRK